ncbi:hypothetical protein JCM6882_001169 [Rhodosporidiobolus microsporus]
MHPSLPRAIRAVPLSSIPPSALRLPPKPTLRRPSASSSPTVERLLKSFAARSTPSAASEAGAGAAGEAQGVLGQAARAELPPNLRIVEYVPKRREYEGVRASHRDLLRRLRREA